MQKHGTYYVLRLYSISFPLVRHREKDPKGSDYFMEHRAVFLDRDGVLNRSIGKRPPNTPEELEMLPGAAKAVKELNDAGFKVFVVTNQGSALGYMTKEDLENPRPAPGGKWPGREESFTRSQHSPSMGYVNCRNQNRAC